MSRLLFAALTLAAATSSATPHARQPPLAGRQPSSIDRAEAELDQAQGRTAAADRFAGADEALRLAEEAAKERPQDPRPLLIAARALSMSDLDHPEACRKGACERAIALLRQARRLDREGPLAESIASELALSLSRNGDFAAALVEYDRALELTEDDSLAFESHTGWIGRYADLRGSSILYGNSAETLMALGRLPEAIERYRRAEAQALYPVERQLAEWGLGVALDRDGQEERAREAVRRALAQDPTLRVLDSSSVFFEPPGDKRYYEALGHETAGDLPQAIAHYRSFLKEAPGSRWAVRARDHLARLLRAKPERMAADRFSIAIEPPLSTSGARRGAPLSDAVDTLRPDLQLCLQRAEHESPSGRGLSGELRLIVDVQPSGVLDRLPQVVGTTIGAEGLRGCLTYAVAYWRLPPVDANASEQMLLTIDVERRAR
jgi:tetratricopeptide (TPR) repeat protein